MYYKFAEDAGVDALLMAPKEKGEGERMVAYQTLVSVDKVKEAAYYFHSFGRPKASHWGGLI